jgi:hypothetical protein
MSGALFGVVVAEVGQEIQGPYAALFLMPENERVGASESMPASTAPCWRCSRWS